MRAYPVTKSLAIGVAVLVVACASNGTAAYANDFFSSLFGAIIGQAPPMTSRAGVPLSYAPDGFNERQSDTPAQRPAYSGSHQAFCVRTCDGRYFPAQSAAGESRAASCNSFCPASETKVFYGSSIDSATTGSGKKYSELPNAFKYRSAIVPGCTCNGNNQFGLAKVDIKDDPTIRKGDLVAGADGLMVARRSADKQRGASLNLSPASAAIRARYARVRVVASD